MTYSDNYKDRWPCVRCGWCCGVGRNEASACAFGEIGEDNKCKYVIEDDPVLGTHKCSQYKEISHLEACSSYPMFGCGCSSPMFNDVRDRVISRNSKI